MNDSSKQEFFTDLEPSERLQPIPELSDHHLSKPKQLIGATIPSPLVPAESPNTLDILQSGQEEEGLEFLTPAQLKVQEREEPGKKEEDLPTDQLHQYITEDEVDPSVAATTVSKNSKFSKSSKYRASIISTYPFLVIAALSMGLAQYPDFLSDAFFKPEQLAQLPQFLQNNIGKVLTFLLYGVAIAMSFVAFKQLAQGTLIVFDDYIKFKKGLFDTKKILYVDLVSITVHKAPMSIFTDIGNIELSSSFDEIKLNNVSKPTELRSLILEKQQIFILGKKT